MPWDRKRLLGYVETIQLILGVTDKICFDSTKHTLNVWLRNKNINVNARTLVKSA